MEMNLENKMRMMKNKEIKIMRVKFKNKNYLKKYFNI